MQKIAAAAKKGVRAWFSHAGRCSAASLHLWAASSSSCCSLAARILADGGPLSVMPRSCASRMFAECIMKPSSIVPRRLTVSAALVCSSATALTAAAASCCAAVTLASCSFSVFVKSCTSAAVSSSCSEVLACCDDTAESVDLSSLFISASSSVIAGE